MVTLSLSLLLLLSLFLYFLWKCSGRWSCSPYPGQMLIWKKKKSERFSTRQMVCLAIIYQRPSTRFNKSQVIKRSKKKTGLCYLTRFHRIQQKLLSFFGHKNIIHNCWLFLFCSDRHLETAAKVLLIFCCFVFSLNNSRHAFVVLPKNFLFAVL